MDNIYRWHACTKLENGSIVVTGGYGETFNTLRTSYRLDMQGGGRWTTWTTLGEMNMARRRHQGAVIGGRLLVVGGWDGDNFLDSVEEMDEDGTWRILPGVTLKTPRDGFSATVVKKNQVCP